MGKKTSRDFLKRLSTDNEFRKKAIEAKTNEAFRSEIKNEYDINQKDFKRAMAAYVNEYDATLSLDELESVAGGIIMGDDVLVPTPPGGIKWNMQGFTSLAIGEEESIE